MIRLRAKLTARQALTIRICSGVSVWGARASGSPLAAAVTRRADNPPRIMRMAPFLGDLRKV
jgi:hypothetical protein